MIIMIMIMIMIIIIIIIIIIITIIIIERNFWILEADSFFLLKWTAFNSNSNLAKLTLSKLNQVLFKSTGIVNSVLNE